jgi:hypothetical protein
MKREYGSGNALTNMLVLVLVWHDCNSRSAVTLQKDI